MKVIAKLTVITAITILFITSAYGLSVLYEWWSQPREITEPPLTCNISWNETINAYVGIQQEIFINIANPTTENITGTLNVEIWNQTTFITSLATDETITILSNSNWLNTYYWTPTTADTYIVRVTFETS